MKIKNNIFDKKLMNQSILGIFGGIYTYVTIFSDMLEQLKNNTNLAIIITLVFIGIYIILWIKSNLSKKFTLNINGSKLEIKIGNIFEQNDFKVIEFSEYFDRIVDDNIISKTSLNGLYINHKLNESIDVLDENLDRELSSRRLKTVKLRSSNKSKS